MVLIPSISDPSGYDSSPGCTFGEFERNEREQSSSPNHFSLAIEPLLTPQRAERSVSVLNEDGEDGNDERETPPNVGDIPSTATEARRGRIRSDVQTTDLGRRNLLECDICLTPSVPKKPAKEITEEDLRILSEVDIPFEGEILRPFSSARKVGCSSASAIESDQIVHFCSDCLKDFKKILGFRTSLEANRGNSKYERKIEKSLQKHIQQYCSRRKRNISGAVKGTVGSRQCFLKHKAGKPCSYGPSGMRVPSRLADVKDAIRNKWVQEFAKKVEVTIKDVREIIPLCCEVYLCSLHGSTYRNVLNRLQSYQKSCSVCGDREDCDWNRRVTKFDWDRHQTQPETKCIIEDSIAACFENTISPRDIQILCDSCRRQILHDVDVRQNVPRTDEDVYSRKAHFRRSKKGLLCSYSHGLTKVAIRMVSNWVRGELLEGDEDVVLMRDIRQKYDEYVVLTGEQNMAFKQDKTIRKHITPSLSISDVHPDVGSKKLGTFFSSRNTLRRLAAVVKGPPQDAEVSADEEADLLEAFKDYILDHQSEIVKSNWELPNFIRAVPHRLWFCWLVVQRPTHMLRRCKARAKLQNRSYFIEWPCNPQECALDMQRLPACELSTVVSLFFSQEQAVFTSSWSRARGPVITAVSLTALTSTSISLLSMLNRLSCAASYQLIDSMRQGHIAERERVGPFESLIPDRFVFCGIDNIKKRTGHSIGVFGSTYNGYDGIALQGVNPNVRYNFTNYCALNLEGNDPRHHHCDKMDFIATFPTADDPDITAYRWVSVGLAVAQRDSIATDDPRKQKSFRRLVMDGLKGFTGGKAKVEYVSVKQCNPNSAYELSDIIRCIEDKYNPKVCKSFTLVAAVGDQPIFKHYFNLWIGSYMKKTTLCR